jgi:hypothetical protein
LLAPGGSYITCGWVGPKNGSSREQDPHNVLTITESLAYAVLKNLQFIGNCLGSTEDLSDAIRDFEDGSYKVVIDSICNRNQIGHFFNRTYSARDRFGKVVYVFD